MSFDPLASLYDDVLELVADARMSHRRAPHVRVEYEAESGRHVFIVLVDSEIVATGEGASLEAASRRCREAFSAWREDRELASTLATSLKLVRAERAAGGSR